MVSRKLVRRLNKTLLIGLLIIVALLLYRAIHKEYLTSELQAKEILLDSLSTTIDEQGREIVVLEQINVSEKTLNKALTEALDEATLEQKRLLARMKGMYVSAQKRIDDRDAKIMALTTAISTMQTTIITGLTDTFYVDSTKLSIPAWGFDQSNQFLKFKGFVLPSTKTIIADIEADLSFTHTIYKKKGIRKLDLMFENPYIRTDNVMTIDLDKVPKKGIGVDISVWAGMDYRGKPSVGIGLSKALFRL